jgi:N-acetylglucosaminyldiphosphoundecaprenol N-acetyl-beta-D-mannosaminyltransferase
MQLKESESRWSDVTVEPGPRARSFDPFAGPPARRRSLPAIDLGGIRIHAIDEQACIRHILDQIAAGSGGFVVTPNVDHLRRCRTDLGFSVLVSQASLVVADGMPLVWASRLQGTPLPQRVAGSDLISSLSAAAAAAGRSIFLLGGEEGTADAAAAVLRERSPKLKVAGTLCPPMGFEMNEIEMGKIIEALQAARPDIVYVALGSPKQEQLIGRIRQVMPQSWWLGVGVSFSFLCGDVKRAPLWMRNLGLEWVHRLIQEPGRLARRYLVVGIPFASSLLFRSMVKGVAARILHRPVERDATPPDDQKEMDIAPEQARNTPANNGQAVESVDAIMSRIPTPATTSASTRGEANDLTEMRETGALHTGGRLKGLILLGGMVRQTAFGGSLGRSPFDLPVGNGKTILTRWLGEAAAVAKTFGLDSLPVRLLVDLNAQEPRSAIGVAGSEHYRMERDTSEYRGTGGLLANISVDYDDDDMILVGNATQVLLDPLSALTLSLMKTRGVVSLIGHRDGEPSGLMLITCRTLRLIPRIGFVDMKEQALPIIASKHDVRVVQCRRPTGLAIRTLSDYIAALRAVNQPTRAAATDPWAEDWKSTFAIVEPGATVASSARIHDSVVLAGANIEANAVVVRSVVAGTVRKDRVAVDQYVEPVPNGAPVRD